MEVLEQGRLRESRHLGIGRARRTLNDLVQRKHLSRADSDLLYRIARAIVHAGSVFEDASYAVQYLKESNEALAGATPLSLLGTVSKRIDDEWVAANSTPGLLGLVRRCTATRGVGPHGLLAFSGFACDSLGDPDFAPLDPGADLGQLSANRRCPFLQDGWHVASLTDHCHNGDKPFCERLVDDVVLADRVETQCGSASQLVATPKRGVVLGDVLGTLVEILEIAVCQFLTPSSV